VGAEEVLYDLPTPYYIEETYMGERKWVHLEPLWMEGDILPFYYSL
jgi:hypothetical protein